MPSFGAIIPTLNEAENLKELKHYSHLFNEIVFVDGNSKDGTIDFIKSQYSRATLVNQGELKGKGSAITLGIMQSSSDYIVLLDADFPVTPEEIKRAIMYCRENPDVDLLKGSRHLKGGGSEDFTFVRSIGAKLFALIARLLFRVRWTEVCYGFWILKREHSKKIGLFELVEKPGTALNFAKLPYGHGFEFDQVLFLKAHKSGLKLAEIPSFELKRNFGPSKLSALKDGFRTLSVLILERIKK